MSDRCPGLRLAARALPPLAPPSFPRATAAGFFAGLGDSGSASPYTISAISFARWFTSVGILERFCMALIVPPHPNHVNSTKIQTETLPEYG